MNLSSYPTAFREYVGTSVECGIVDHFEGERLGKHLAEAREV